MKIIKNKKFKSDKEETSPILISFADNKYKKAQHLNSYTGLNIAGFNTVYEFGPEDIPEKYIERHKDIFSYKRGRGLWLWKPYFVYQTLLHMNMGEKLIYIDSAAFWIKKATPIFDILENEDIYITELPLIEKQFTKKIVFDEIGCKNDQIAYISSTNQIQASIIGIKKTPYSLAFVKKWLGYCEMIRLIAPDIYNTGIDSTYLEHREDQSILSIYSKVENIRAHKDPSQYGKVPWKYYRKGFLFKESNAVDSYNPILILHRSGSLKLLICAKQMLLSLLPRKICFKIGESKLRQLKK